MAHLCRKFVRQTTFFLRDNISSSSEFGVESECSLIFLFFVLSPVCTKLKSDSGISSPESFDGDYGTGVPAAKRVNLESPLAVNPTVQTPSHQEILTRAFPALSPIVLELVLKGCNGNIVQTIEVITQSSMLTQPSIMPFASQQPANEAGTHGPAPSPLYPPLFKLNYMNSQYRFFMPPSMMPYMFPGPSGLGFPAPPFPPSQPEASEAAGNSGNGVANFDGEKTRQNGAETLCSNCGRATNYNERCSECSSGNHRQ